MKQSLAFSKIVDHARIVIFVYTNLMSSSNGQKLYIKKKKKINNKKFTYAFYHELSRWLGKKIISIRK